MSVNCRFALDEKRKIIDAVNAANSGKAYPCFEGDPEDDKHLRESVLVVRLSELVKKLIINLRPREKGPWGEEEYEPRNEEADSISTALFYTINASHLNTFEPTMSLQHKFDGKLRRQKKRTQDFTSLSLFRDEVECLLRDLYGDIESEALDSIVCAVFRIVEEFTQYVRPDLAKEHHDAWGLDYSFGIGLPEGDCLQSTDWLRGMVADRDLILRVCEVRKNPSAFSAYTVEFADRFSEMRVCSAEAAANVTAAMEEISRLWREGMFRCASRAV
jgi:hypothetical protein